MESGDEQRRALEDWKYEDYTSDPQGDLPRLPNLSDNKSSSPLDSCTDDFQVEATPSAPKTSISEDQSSTSNDMDVKREASDSDFEMPSQRQRTASQVLYEAKVILDGMSSTNHTARYAAECLESINVSYTFEAEILSKH